MGGLVSLKLSNMWRSPRIILGSCKSSSEMKTMLASVLAVSSICKTCGSTSGFVRPRKSICGKTDLCNLREPSTPWYIRALCLLGHGTRFCCGKLDFVNVENMIVAIDTIHEHERVEGEQAIAIVLSKSK